MSSPKDNPHCLVCTARVGVSTRNSQQIFSKESRTCTEKPLVQVMRHVLEEQIEESTAHSLLICKKCFKLFNEFDDVEQRLLEIKDELKSMFKKTVEKEYDMDDESVKVKRETLSPSREENKENHIPKKILDIPSSDEDTSHSQEPSDRSSYQAMEDIELQLEKIHGGESNGAECIPQIEIAEEGGSFQEFAGEIVDAGAVDHSSDSDYEPPNRADNAEVVVQAATAIDNHIEKVTIKTEEGSEDRSILIKKAVVADSKKIVPRKAKEREEPVFEGPLVHREGNLYTCMVCDGENTVCGEAKAIIIHMRNNHDLKLYICDVCGQDFRKRNELSAHLDDHVATEEGDFQCEVCNRIFSNLRLFRIHKRMHYPQNKAWPCDTCGKKYSSKNLLDEHINTHTGVRPYVCAVCGKDFASKYTFKAHERTHEIRPRPFQCTHCPKSFLSQQNLTQHERTHTGVKEFGCDLCDKQFGSAHNLEVHSIVHTGYKPFICGTCGKAFARKAEIRDHERTHTGERPYQCEFCGATFSQRSNLQSHKRATHYDDKRYKCDSCGKGFKRRRLLDYHIKAAHTGERPYKCSICNATFVYPEHFKKHSRIHTGEKPFLCEVCGKAFNSRDNRNAHRFVHSDKKPYECLVCGAGFMRKPLLYQHMQTQGHLNDTIVVNQPRLTTDDDQVITVNADGEMEIIEGEPVTNLESIEMTEEDGTEDSKLYIAEQLLVEQDMFNDSKAFVVDGSLDDEDDQMVESNSVEHIIVDGHHIQFVDEGEDAEEVEDIEDNDESTQHVLSTEEYEHILSSGMVKGKTQIIQGPDGPIQYVQVRIPNMNGEEEDAWLKIVSEEKD